MGFQHIVAAGHYARFVCPEGESTFSLHHINEAINNHRVVIYFECRDLDQRVEQLQEIGFTFRQAPKDEPWLWREARLLDPDNNEICLYWAGDNRLNPPWRLSD